MKSGTIVEYIDQQKIICAAVLELKNKRLRLLTENDREVSQSASRITFESDAFIDTGIGRTGVIKALKETVSRRRQLKESIDLKELWELLNGENEWVDLTTMAEYCFSDTVNADHKSAVIRAFFENRLYFKFDHNRFFPYSAEHVENAIAREEEKRKQALVIQQGSEWLKTAISQKNPELPENLSSIPEILKSFYIYDKESPHFSTGREIMSGAGINSPDALFRLLVNLGILSLHENLDLLRMEIPRTFSDDTVSRAKELESSEENVTDIPGAEDYTHVRAITVDGQSTTDYDDALSIEKIGDSYILGIHISDVARYVERDDILDRKAQARGTTIYMPDMKIPMLPPELSENICSLIENKTRACISIIVTLNRFFEIKEFEVVPTKIIVTRQLTYTETGMMAESDDEIATLIKIAKAFREKRLSSGATQITLPEVNVFLDESDEIVISRIDRESPSRMMVSEMMIMANWLFASFLSRKGLPGIFRSQHEPKERLYRGESDSIFLNALQRKHVSRAIISNKAGHHSGLGLDAYVTATSPIRRYYDLITQRQIKAALGSSAPYDENQINQITQMLESPVSNAGKIQNNRKRYWLLRYLEAKTGTRTDAVVLDKRKNSYTIMLTEYMLEYSLPASGLKLKPQDMISVVIQHANARKDSFSVYIG